MNCGIINDDPQTIQLFGKRGETDPLFESGGDPLANSLVSDPGESCQWTDRNGTPYLVAYTDGSVFRPKSARFAHGGWAVYYGPGEQANRAAPLYGYRQIVYRAELRAIIHVASTAYHNTVIKCDCASVVETANRIIAEGENALLPDKHRDLWQSAKTLLTGPQAGKILIEWMPAHLNDDGYELKRKAALEQGVVTTQDLEGNEKADGLAKLGASLNSAPRETLEYADIRARVARAAQDMYVAIWLEYRRTSGMRAEDADGVSDFALLSQFEEASYEEDQEVEFESEDPWGFGHADIHGNDIGLPEHKEETIASGAEPQEQAPSDENNEDSKDTEKWKELQEEVEKRYPHFASPAHGEDGVTVEYGQPHKELVLPKNGGVAFKDSGGKWRRAYPLRVAMEPIVWWLKRQKWSKDKSDADPGIVSQGATYLELVAHLFICTGMLPGHNALPAWTQAKLLATLMKSMATQLKLHVNGVESQFQKCFRPAQLATTQPITMCAAVGGVQRRPIWSDSERRDVGAHLLMVKRSDGIWPGFGTASPFRRRGLRREWQHDYVAEAVDLIAAMRWGDTQCAEPAQQLRSVRPEGPCVAGHTSTTVSNGRSMWYRAAQCPEGDAIKIGDTICHRCYMSLRARIRGSWRKRPHGDVEPGEDDVYL